MNFEEHKDVLQAVKKAQDADHDQREAAREAEYFVNKRDGQWEPQVVEQLRNKPRYTDDRTNPIVNQIVGEIENADFTIRVRPSGGDSSKDIADIYDDLIRNIRNMSKFETIKNHSARIATESGIDGWEIVHDYADNKSFDQDLLIKPLYNFKDRVWFLGGLERDGSDASGVVIYDFVSPSEYEELWPEGSKESLSTDSWSDAYYYKQESIIVARVFYKKKKKATLARLTTGAIVEIDDDFEKIRDDLELAQIFVEDEREIEKETVYIRTMDNSGWLDDEEATVFETWPVVPVLANFKISEGKILYRGAVEKLMDIQRVHNYAFSRNVEEVALNPRQKIFMTKKQAAGADIQESLRTLNTNMDPVQFYVPDPDAPPPYRPDMGTPNNAVLALVQQTEQSIASSAGVFAANMGDNPGLQSGIAIEKQIDRGNNSSAPYFEALKVAVIRTGEILIKTIPRVYDSTRQVRLIGEDGTIEQKVINQTIIDNETGEPITVNDLSIGQYDVVCDIGAKYKNRQQESAEQLARLAQYDPALIELSRDLILKNLNEPGMDKAAERARQVALNQGVIPQSQMTEEELAAMQEAQAQAAQNPPPVDPAAMAMAEAEMVKAQAEMLNAQNKQAELQINAQKNQIEMAKIQLGNEAQIEKTQSETAVNIAKIEQEQQKIDQSYEKQVNEMALKLAELESKVGQQLDAEVKKNRLVFNPQTGRLENA